MLSLAVIIAVVVAAFLGGMAGGAALMFCARVRHEAEPELEAAHDLGGLPPLPRDVIRFPSTHRVGGIH